MTYDPGSYALEHFSDWRVTSLSLGGALGITAPAYKLIAIEISLPRYLWDETLDHELCHLILGHNKTASCWHEGKQERGCWRTSARRMITLQPLARAVQWCGLQPGHLAEELGRSEALVQVRLEAAHPSEKHYLRRVAQHHWEAA